ncbi:3D domain-containing protein [Paenibacillus sp. OV219]|uniref:3D domain-containing protein n=1 Tax=Paenibacillus sp. OV219 TaxID=1884377 RepID=UPI00210EC2CE|nr:3D domain-containing protein [Paenibacillus sp. OV219]
MTFRSKMVTLGVVIGCSLLFHSIATAPDQPDLVTVPYVTPIKTVPVKITKKVKQHSKKVTVSVTGVATAYCNCKDTMNGETGVTAAGYDLDNGIKFKGYHILASDKRYKFGTLVDITLESGRTIHGIVMDRGGAVKGNHFDIVYQSRDDAYEFGRQHVKFEIKGRLDI